MCNLYSVTTSVDAMRRLFRLPFRVPETNLPPLPGIFPDNAAPIIRNTSDGERELAVTRWGMPTPKSVLLTAAKTRADKLRAKGKDVDFAELLRLEPDSGVTNVRKTESKYWQPWLGVANRCLVPFTSFSEFNKAEGGDIWFALGEERTLAFFAGIWLPQWTSVRKVREGEVTADLFAFLTTEPNAEVGAIHPKAMPVILTEPGQCETWMTAEWPIASYLQRPLLDDNLQIVARGRKRDVGPGTIGI